MSNITIDPFRFNVPPIGGCMDPIALNFNPLATFSSGPCVSMAVILVGVALLFL